MFQKGVGKLGNGQKFQRNSYNVITTKHAVASAQEPCPNPVAQGVTGEDGLVRTLVGKLRPFAELTTLDRQELRSAVWMLT
jgi:hypothetical protein